MAKPEHEDSRVISFPKWFLSSTLFIVCLAGGWAYNTGCDIAVIRANLTTCLEKFVEQGNRIEKLEDRVNRIETGK